jgi:hypothetical protein
MRNRMDEISRPFKNSISNSTCPELTRYLELFEDFDGFGNIDFTILATGTFPLLGEWQLQTLARQHGIRKDRETDILDKLFAAFLRRADEGTLSRLLIEVSVLLASGRSNGSSALRDAATAYKVDTDAIALKVKQEFAAKEKAKKEGNPATSDAVKRRKAA